MPDNLQQAIIAIKSGDTKTGRELLMEVLKADSRNENAWLWMTQVLDSDDERIKCLQTVLKINPDNEKARRGLATLRQRQANPKLKPIKKTSLPPKISLPKDTKTTNRKTPLVVTILAIIGFLALVLCGCFFIFLLPELSKPKVIATIPNSENVSRNTPSPPRTNSQIFEMGQVIEIGGITLVLLSWEEVYSEFSEPEPAHKFIAVEILFTNVSSTDVTVFANTMFLKDSEARSYPLDWNVTSIVKGGRIGGVLVPGEQLRNKLGFQVPTEVQALQFIFEDPTKGKVIINLGPNPINVETTP